LIARPVEDLFDSVADKRNEPRYNPHMRRAEKLTPGPIGHSSNTCHSSRAIQGNDAMLRDAGRVKRVGREATAADQGPVSTDAGPRQRESRVGELRAHRPHNRSRSRRLPGPSLPTPRLIGGPRVTRCEPEGERAGAAKGLSVVQTVAGGDAPAKVGEQTA